MNELQVKTIKIEPAVIEFNHEDIEEELETNLKKYEGLVFSEDNATDLRKTLAELRKGKYAVDRYRIDTKKKLNEPVNEFEDKCKKLDKRFNDVITPLVEQQNEFEEKRRAEKLVKLEKIRLEHIENHELAEEYHEQVIIEDSMLTKSASLKQSGDSLEFQVKKLKSEQDKKASDIQLINTTTELVNAKNELGFSADAYVRLLEYKPVEEITKQIENDAENEVNKRKIEEELNERKEQERQEELERIQTKQAEVEQAEEMKEQHEDEPFERVYLNSAPSGISNADDLPFTGDPFMNDPFIADPFAEEEKEAESTVIYKVTGTDKQLMELLNFLLVTELSYEVID